MARNVTIKFWKFIAEEKLLEKDFDGKFFHD